MSEDSKTLSSKILRSQFRFVAEQLCTPVVSGATKPERVGEPDKSFAQVDPVVAPRGLEAPAKPRQRQRVHPLGVRFSAAEVEIVRRKAKDAGCSVNSYIRASTLGSDYKPPVHQELRLTLLASNRELTALGRNLNQIAKQMNSGMQVGRITLDSLQAALFTTLAMVRTALARRPSGE